MNDVDRLATSAAHAAHDLTNVAALAARARDLDATTAASARRQVADCTACADVLADLTVLQTALPTTATPARQRDFRLTTQDAARLHRTGWRRFLGFFGSARDGISRPLAIGFTTLGLAGLLVATVPTAFMAAGPGGSEILAPVGGAAQNAAPGSAEAYSTERMAASADASGEPADGGVFSGAGLDQETDIAAELAIRDDASGLSVLFVLGGVLLLAGLGLFGLRWSARRLL